MLRSQALAFFALIGYATAAPQIWGIGTASQCNPVKEFKTEHTEDASVWEMWQNKNNVCHGECDVGSQQADSITVAYSWNVGGSMGLKEALDLGLDFGMEVSTTHEDATVIQEHCPAEMGEECYCGLVYRILKEKATGQLITHWPAWCHKEQSEPFEVVAPVLKGGKTKVEWSACKSSSTVEDKCHSLVGMMPCPNGA